MTVDRDSRLPPDALVEPFTRLVTLSFYDGPEDGFATSATGTGFRFASLCDSKSGCYRAFEIQKLSGEWGGLIRRLLAANNDDPTSKLIWPSPEGELDALKLAISSAPIVDQFLAIGDHYLKRLLICRVTEPELGQIRALGYTPAAFRAVHRWLKKTEKLRALP